MRNIRWTVGRRIAVITCIGLASAVLVALVAWVGAGDRRRTTPSAPGRTTTPASLVQQLDTRSSELKVDGFKAVTLDDPTTAQADVADDTQQVADMIAALRKLDLDPDDKAAVTDLEAAFAAYTTSIGDVRRRRRGRPGRPARERREDPGGQREDGRRPRRPRRRPRR